MKRTSYAPNVQRILLVEQLIIAIQTGCDIPEHKKALASEYGIDLQELIAVTSSHYSEEPEDDEQTKTTSQASDN